MQEKIKSKKDFIRDFQNLRSTDCIPAMFEESFKEVDTALLDGIDGVALVPDVFNGNGILVSLDMHHDDYDDDEDLLAPSPKKKASKKKK